MHGQLPSMRKEVASILAYVWPQSILKFSDQTSLRGQCLNYQLLNHGFIMVHGYDEFYPGLDLHLIPYTRIWPDNTQRACDNKI